MVTLSLRFFSYLQEEKEKSLVFLHDSKEGKETNCTLFTLSWKSFKRGERRNDGGYNIGKEVTKLNFILQWWLFAYGHTWESSVNNSHSLL